MIDVLKHADIASAAFTFAAAVLWLFSAGVKIPQTFSVKVITTHTGDGEFPGAQVVGQGFGASNELNYLGRALIKQSKLSAGAAACAAIAAMLQALMAIGPHN